MIRIMIMTTIDSDLEVPNVDPKLGIIMDHVLYKRRV